LSAPQILRYVRNARSVATTLITVVTLIRPEGSTCRRSTKSAPLFGTMVLGAALLLASCPAVARAQDHWQIQHKLLGKPKENAQSETPLTSLALSISSAGASSSA
jgi:hypothetical protein